MRVIGAYQPLTAVAGGGKLAPRFAPSEGQAPLSLMRIPSSGLAITPPGDLEWAEFFRSQESRSKPVAKG